MFADALLLHFIVGQHARTLVCFLHVLHFFWCVTCECALLLRSDWLRETQGGSDWPTNEGSLSLLLGFHNIHVHVYMYVHVHMYTCVCHSGTYTCTCTAQELILRVYLVSTSSAMHRFRVLLSLIANKAVILSVVNNLSYCLCTWTFCKSLSKGH